MDKRLKQLQILLVEDDLDIQAYFQEIFEYFFKKVFLASNGYEALKILDQENISAIFSDYDMPGLNGHELVLKLRQSDNKIPITIISNYDNKEVLQKFIPLNLEGYLFKPLNYDDIKEYIQKLSHKLIKNLISIHHLANNYYIDLPNHKLKKDDMIYSITKLDASFLKLLLYNKNQVLSYDTIFEHLFEYSLDLKNLKNLVYRIRTKYKFDSIKNIKDVGYILIDD